MAVIQPNINSTGGRDLVVWETITSADTAQAYEPSMVRMALASIQVVGTFDSATVVLQGSNDGNTWVSLNDAYNDPISFTATGEASLWTGVRYVRPSVSGGGGSQDLDVYLVARGAV